MKYVITSSASQEAIIAAVRAVDPNATIDCNLHPLDELRNDIRSDMSAFHQGFINSSNIKERIEMGKSIGLQVVDQIRYNGADVTPMVGIDTLYSCCEALFNETALDIIDEINELWGNRLCGDMLEDLDGLAVIMLFGTQPCEDVVNAFKNGVLQCTVIDDMDAQKAIFSNYDKFVNDVLNGVDFSDKITVDVCNGYDS